MLGRSFLYLFLLAAPMLLWAQSTRKQMSAGELLISPGAIVSADAGRAAGDTLLYFDGSVFFPSSADAPLFGFTNIDRDKKFAAPDLAPYFSDTSSFKFFYADAGGEVVHFIGAHSYFKTPGTANNWFSFGPVTIPAAGAHMFWQHAMPDNAYRDGYRILMTTKGLADTSFTEADTVLKIADMSPLTAGDNQLYEFESLKIPSKFNDSLIYIAFQHNANNKFILYLDEVVVKETDPLSVAGHERVHVKVYPNPAREQVCISLPLGVAIREVAIFDVTGKRVTVRTPSIPHSSFNVDTSALPPGLYHVVVNGMKPVKLVVM